MRCRYPKIPVWDKSFSTRTGVAFDLMAINFGDLEVMPHLIEPLKHVFADECMGNESTRNEDS